MTTWGPGVVLDLAGALVVCALGALVLLVKPRTRGNAWFALFALAFGGNFVVTNVALGLDVPRGAFWVEVGRIVLRLVASVCAVMLALEFPHGIEARERRAVRAAFALGALALVGILATSVAARGDAPLTLAAVADLTFGGLSAALFAALFALALRYGEHAETSRERASFALMSAAILVYLGLVAGAGSSAYEDLRATIFSDSTPEVLRSAFEILLLGGLAALWLRHAHVATEETVTPRNVALLSLGMPLVGMLFVLYAPSFGGFGLARILAVGILAYAIVQHQLLGIDVKVRWGISKSTVAGVFIAGFFVASEAAQEFFGDALGSQYVGIVAAGALVFGLAPLSRLADRLAERAVPVVPPPARTPGTDPLNAYRGYVETAWSDGKLARKERLLLRALRDELRISATDADRIEREVESGGEP